MSKYKVLTDGNGSDLIQVVGLGIYVPLSKLQAAQHEAEALAATVEALRKYIESGAPINTNPEKCERRKLLTSTPQQHLRDVRSEAGRAGFIAGLEYPDKVHFEGATRNPVFAADEYAERVKAGEE